MLITAKGANHGEMYPKNIAHIRLNPTSVNVFILPTAGSFSVGSEILISIYPFVVC